jgi:hypothetical protein
MTWREHQVGAVAEKPPSSLLEDHLLGSVRIYTEAFGFQVIAVE